MISLFYCAYIHTKKDLIKYELIKPVKLLIKTNLPNEIEISTFAIINQNILCSH